VETFIPSSFGAMHPSPMGRRTSGSLLVALAVWAALSMQSLFAMPKGSSDGVQESRENVGRDVNRWKRTLLPTKHCCMFYIVLLFLSKVFEIIPVGLCCQCCHTLRSRIWMVCFLASFLLKQCSHPWAPECLPSPRRHHLHVPGFLQP